MSRILGLLIAVSLFFAASATAEPDVRVLVVEGAKSLHLTPRNAFSVSSEAGEIRVAAPGEALVVAPSRSAGIRIVSRATSETLARTTAEVIQFRPVDPDGLLEMADVPYGVGWWWAGTEDRSYDGLVEFRRTESNAIDVIVQLPVEEYLRGVVPSEIGPTAPEEALKAQAVAARSETMTALRERVYAGPHHDICADVNCQVYAGIGRRNEATDAAIRATRGLVIAYEGASIPAYYASNCGGHSENIENVWPERDRGIPCWDGVFEGPGNDPGDLSDSAVFAQWVASRPAVYCNRDAYPELPEWTQKNFRWTREISAVELGERVATLGKDIGRIVRIEPLERGVSGRLNRVKFVGMYGQDVTVGPELAIRRVWESPLKSSAFVVKPDRKDGPPEMFLIEGAGYGHGVGLCQTGAMARATEGQDFRQILTHYYSGTEVIAAYE
ncbi:MAG: SpoIID/LytB domain-containing protein [Sumerlaeia bacterium]